MKKIAIVLAFLMALLNSEELQLNLKDFANLASSNSKVDILISDEIDPNDFYFYSDKNSDISISHFRKAIEIKGLKLVLTEKFYYVDKIYNDDNTTKQPNKKLRYIELKNNSFSDIKSVIDTKLNSNLNDFNNPNSTSEVKYIKSTNSVVFNADDDEFSDILEITQKADKRLDQIRFKLLITETNINDAKHLGTHINSLIDGITRADLNYFINLITMPFTAETNVINSKRQGFYGVLNLLEENGITTIKQSPFLVAKSGNKVYFSSVQNIPYLVKNQEINDTRNTTSNSYEYRDVGLKIEITPVIFDDYVDFDLNLIVEDLLDENTLTPKTSKKELKSSYTLNRGEVLVLSGINKDTTYQKRNGIPFLKDIPIIQYLFSINSDYKASSVISLSIEAY
ncbi:MAG: type II and III secretion system protein [Campylobacter sp.]|nr:type II and III secretion system protein [Campylobacter sp.]